MVYELRLFFGITLLCSKLYAFCICNSLKAITHFRQYFNQLYSVVAGEALDQLTWQSTTTCHFTDGETWKEFTLFQKIYCIFFLAFTSFREEKLGRAEDLPADQMEYLPGFFSTMLWDCHLFDYDSSRPMRSPQHTCHPCTWLI